MQRRISIFVIFISAWFFSACNNPADTDQHHKVLLGMTGNFVQTVPGTLTNEWVFRCDRVWRKNDSTIQMFEYEMPKNRTRRSTFVNDDLVAIDLFYWQNKHVGGIIQSVAFHVPVPTERAYSDVPEILRKRSRGL